MSGLRAKLLTVCILLAASACLLLSGACGGSGVNKFEVLHGLITFASDRTGNWEIFSMTTYGLNLRQLTNDGAADTEPRWSRDSKLIAFSSNRTGNWEVFLMNADGTDLVNLTNDPASDDQCPAWSGDGQKIIYQRSVGGDADLYTVDVASLAKNALTSGASNDLQPAWSSFTHKIAFISDRNGGKQLFLMNDDGTNIHQLVATAGDCAYPAFAPDNSLLAFVTAQQLWTIDENGANLTQRTDLLGDNTYPRWNPTSKYLLYDTDRDGTWQMYVVGLTGSYLVPVARNAFNDLRGDWTLQ